MALAQNKLHLGFKQPQICLPFKAIPSDLIDRQWAVGIEPRFVDKQELNPSTIEI